MGEKAKLKLVELDADQVRTLLKGNVLKLEKEGVRLSIAMSRDDVEELCAEIAASSAEEAGEEDQEDGSADDIA